MATGDVTWRHHDVTQQQQLRAVQHQLMLMQALQPAILPTTISQSGLYTGS